MNNTPINSAETSAKSSLAKRRGRRRKISRTISYIVLTLGALTMVVPFIWMISTSLKTLAEVFVFPPHWIPDQAKWGNYVTIFRDLPFLLWFKNSIIVAGSVTLGQLITCSFAGYAFARLEFPGKNILFLTYLGTLMVPYQVRMIPLFIIIKNLGLMNTYQAMILPGLFSAFGTFLLRQFFQTIPTSLEEAAIIDGASRLRTYFTIILPLSKPALATLAVFTFMRSWNSFLWPLIVTFTDEMRVLTVGLASFQGYYTTDYPKLMAGSVVAIIPVMIVFLAAQKYFVRGITLTGIKG